MLDVSRVIAHTNKNFCLFPDSPGTVVVVTAQRFTVAKRFYEEAAFRMNLDLLVEPHHVATRSSSTLISLTPRNGGSDSAFVRCHRQFVSIDMKTRKTVDITNAVRQHFGNALTGQALRIEVLPLPVRHFRYEVRVQHSVTDFLNHVNQSEFLRYCLDAAAQASHAGHLRNFTADLFEYRVRQADLLHQGEGFPGDTLDVAVWEDERRTDTLHFQIMKGTQRVLFCSVSFYKDAIPLSKL